MRNFNKTSLCDKSLGSHFAFRIDTFRIVTFRIGTLFFPFHLFLYSIQAVL